MLTKLLLKFLFEKYIFIWLKLSESLKFIFWIIIEGSIKETLLLINISLAANFPSIFVDCTAIAA